MMLTDLADACRKSGLIVVELAGWRTNGRPASTGGFDPQGVDCHHTGGESDSRAYAEWMAWEGRPDLPAPLAQTALSRRGIVYVLAAGRANHAGEARASGPMPAGDGNAIYLGVEAMNTGSEGWDHQGVDAAGNPVTQGEAYARLCAALCAHYGWPAAHVRAHRETSTTGKWDPGLLDMDTHRAAVAAAMVDLSTEGLDMNEDDVRRIIREELGAAIRNELGKARIPNPKGAGTWTLGQLLWHDRNEADTIRVQVTK